MSAAVWTRFFPLTRKLQSLLHEDKVIGDVVTVFADFSQYTPPSQNPPSLRTTRADAAGVLLDLGMYTLLWASLALDKHPARTASRNNLLKPRLVASMTFTSETDAARRIDEHTAITLAYPDLSDTAVCTSSFLRRSPAEFAQIYGSKGSIAIGGAMTAKPEYLVIRVDGEEDKRVDFGMAGFGFICEADAVAADLRAGKLENEICSVDDSLMILERLDEARGLCGLTYEQDE